MEDSVVREAVVVGGRVEGEGRLGLAGMRRRRWVASARGVRRSVVAERCILVVVVVVVGVDERLMGRGGEVGA